MGASRPGLVFICVLLLTMLVSSAARADVSLGASLGLDNGSLSGDAPSDVGYSGGAGFKASVVGEIRLASDVWLSLQPSYVQRVTKVNVARSDGTTAEDSLRLNLDYVTLPILCKINTGAGKTYVTGGFELGFLQEASLVKGECSEDIADSFKDFDVAFEFGFGVMLPIGGPRLTLEARYSQSITNVADVTMQQSGEMVPLRARFSGFQLLFGVLFPLWTD